MDLDSMLEALQISVEEKRQLVINSESFREAAILAKSFLTAQSYGAILEAWIKNHFDLESKIDELSGDASIKGKTIEIKVSIQDAKGGFNFVQLRPSHEVDYYLFATFNISQDKVTWILATPENLYPVIADFGGYAHGTIKAQGEITIDSIKGSSYEYALRPSENANKNTKATKCWQAVTEYEVTENELRSILHEA
jgi:hypothetical protein